MYDIWGSSSNDVYTVGHNSRNRGFMWHYDGNKWKDVSLTTSEGGQISGAIDLTSIYGFSTTNIYAAGASIGYNPNPPPNYIGSNLIIHYDGTSWKQLNINGGRPVYAIYGNSSTDIWAGGFEKKIYHFNGSKWETDSINISVPSSYSFGISSISSNNSNYYLIGNSNNNNTGEIKNYFFKKMNNDWVLLDSTVNSNYKFGFKLNRGKLPDLYSYGGGGIYKYDGIAWSKFYPTSYTISSMWGTSNKNIFAVDGAGGVFHYNGVDWKKLEFGYPTDYWAVWTDGTEAFIVGHINDGVAQKTIIWHGK